MRRKRLFVQLFASCLLLSVLSLLAVGLLASRALRVFYLGEMRAGLAARARMLEGPHARAGGPAGLDGVGRALQRGRGQFGHAVDRDSARWPGGGRFPL